MRVGARSRVSALIAALDSALTVNSEEIKLRRSVGTTNKVNVDVTLRAKVRSPTADEIVGAITQKSFVCIFSPTEINAAQWPGGQMPGGTEDPRIPNKDKGDTAYVRGRWREVERGEGLYPDGLVRIEMWVLG